MLITVGYQVQLGVVVKDKYGNVIDGFPTPTWAIDSDVASISQEGLLVAGTVPAVANVSATVGGITGTAEVSIEADEPAVVEIVAGVPEQIPYL